MKKLTRDEMKNIIGGYISPVGDLPLCNCNNADDCSVTNEKCMSSCSGGTGAGHCGCP
jgi:bacteriocin-like protein